MSRAWRIEYPGCCYHVMNRGNQRLKVFASDSDYSLFIEKLTMFFDSFNVNILSYCLMPNHFHLYVQTIESNLSRFMHSFLTSFSLKLNRRRKRCGHIFQGRFKSHVVDDEAYGMLLSRYIHLNPIRTLFFRDKSMDVKRNPLVNFKWSSYGAYAGYSPVPDCLHVEKILEKYCRGRISPSEIGRMMQMSQSGVAQAEHRFHKTMHSDRHIKRMMNAFEQAIKSKVGV